MMAIDAKALDSAKSDLIIGSQERGVLTSFAL